MRKGFTFLELIFVILIFGVLLGGIGFLFNAEPKTINGVTYDTYGIASEGNVRNNDIEYELNGWSVWSSIVLLETVIVPVYQLGWNLYEPVEAIDKNSTKIKGAI